jgi:hypothetical protein
MLRKLRDLPCIDNDTATLLLGRHSIKVAKQLNRPCYFWRVLQGELSLGRHAASDVRRPDEMLSCRLHEVSSALGLRKSETKEPSSGKVDIGKGRQQGV